MEIDFEKDRIIFKPINFYDEVYLERFKSLLKTTEIGSTFNTVFVLSIDNGRELSTNDAKN